MDGAPVGEAGRDGARAAGALDDEMRGFEALSRGGVPAGRWIVARLDGRGFTRLTKETVDLVKPYDERFRDLMIGTAVHLMGCGPAIHLGYTQSDEISLLFDVGDCSFGRRVVKTCSVLAGEASAHFSAVLGVHAVFDCRLVVLPGVEEVPAYFR